MQMSPSSSPSIIHQKPPRAASQLPASAPPPSVNIKLRRVVTGSAVSHVKTVSEIIKTITVYSTFQHKWAMYPRPRPLLRNRKLGHVSGPRARVSTPSEGVWCRHNCGQWRSLLLCAELCHTDPELMYGDATAIFLFGFWLFKVTRGFNVQANRVAHACRVDPLKVRGGSPLRVLWSCLGWWLAVFVSLTHYCGILWPDSCRPAQPPNCPVTAHKRGQHTALILQHSSHFLRWSAFVFVVL